jgi:hypothetical protein
MSKLIESAGVRRFERPAPWVAYRLDQIFAHQSRATQSVPYFQQMLSALSRRGNHSINTFSIDQSWVEPIAICA